MLLLWGFTLSRISPTSFLHLSSVLSISFLFVNSPLFLSQTVFDFFLFIFLHSSYFSDIHASVNMSWYNLQYFSKQGSNKSCKGQPGTKQGQEKCLLHTEVMTRPLPPASCFLILMCIWIDEINITAQYILLGRSHFSHSQSNHLSKGFGVSVKQNRRKNFLDVQIYRAQY